MAWSFVLTDALYKPVGEILNASERKVAKPISNLDTASFTVRLDNPLADDLMGTMGHIKAYRDGSLEFFGPIVSAEESASKDSQTVAVNAVGSGWVLTKRFAGKSATGNVFSIPKDRALISKDLIDTTNTENETGISTALNSISSASTVTYTAGPFRPVSECIKDLATAVDGFDWRILPVENYAGGAVTGQKIGSFAASPVIGTLRYDTVYEYGTGRNNIGAYTRSMDRSTQANKVFHYTSAGPDAPGYPTVSALDPQSISDYKLLEDLAQIELLDPGLRQNYVNEHVRIRKTPKQTITFTPHIDPQRTGRLPRFGTDFTIGDFVVARAVYGGTVRFNGFFRVWGIEFTIDSNGVEQQTLTLVQEN